MPDVLNGRPPKKIYLEEIESLAAIGCKLSDMAAWLKISKRTMQRAAQDPRVIEAIRRGRGRGRVSVLRAQFQAALAGDRTMLIWIGKNFLGQSDKLSAEVEHDVHVKILEGVSLESLR